jgi:hypothetical protein
MPVNPLVVFQQYGYREVRITNDGHSVGNCPFCEKEEHFFINVKSANKTWDCKRCGRGGGFKIFLTEVVKFAAQQFELMKNEQEILKQSRSLRVDTFKKLGVGYMPSIDSFLIPVWSHDESRLLNVKIYDKRSFRNSATCLSGMYATWLIPKNHSMITDVYITEGEWDTMTMIECLDKLKMRNAIVIGAPGAGTFKQDVFPFLVGKSVHILYDNDLAGTNGTEKVAALISPMAAQVTRIKWPEGTPDGFDIRDLYKQNNLGARITLDKIKTLSVVCTVKTNATYIPNVETEPVEAKEVYSVFKKWLHLPDLSLLDVIFGTIIANKLDGDPLWMFIVAPPGGTKTEPLLSLSGGAGMEMLSSLTPHTLISGSNLMGGPDPSLIPSLNGKMLIIKDFTTVWGLPSIERDEIISILRDVYDGECAKAFGNGIIRRYKSKFGILAATTPIIEQMTEEHAQLGERFLRWRNWIPESIKCRRVYIEKALANTTHEVELRTELNAIAKRVLLGKYDSLPSVSDDMRARIVGMAQWISTMRGTVNRDKYSRDVTHKSFTELGTRLSKQLYKLLLGVTMFHCEKAVTEETYKVAVTVAKASISQRYLDAVNGICRIDPEKWHTTTELQKSIGLPKTTCDIVLGNLEMLNVVTREIEQGKARWKLNPDMLELMVRCKLL